MTSYGHQIEYRMTIRDHYDYTVDVMTMFIDGKPFESRDVVNIHETFGQRKAQVERELYARWMNS